MKRRSFIKSSLLGCMAVGLTGIHQPGKTHLLTLSFDDGFKKSFYRIAEIHEKYGLHACLNVIATGHRPEFDTEPVWIPQKLLGNFDDWNTLKNRGHEIMPHTWDHKNLTEIPVDEAKHKIDLCLDYFSEHLEGYKDEDAVYNFAYNASNPDLDQYALKRVRAVRTGGWLVLKNTMVNLIPLSLSPAILGCWSHGPDFADHYVEEEVNKFLTGTGGWLILNLHGLDEEGWGPLSTSYLDGLLKRLITLEYLEIGPAGSILRRV